MHQGGGYAYWFVAICTACEVHQQVQGHQRKVEEDINEVGSRVRQSWQGHRHIQIIMPMTVLEGESLCCLTTMLHDHSHITVKDSG